MAWRAEEQARELELQRRMNPATYAKRPTSGQGMAWERISGTFGANASWSNNLVRNVAPTPPPGGGRTTPPTPRATARPGSGPSGPSAAQSAAREQAAAMARAGARFQKQAGNLDPQIDALKKALDVEFKRNLDQNLGDISMLLDEQFAMLKKQSGERGEDFLVAARNNETALAGQQEGSLSNFTRERAETMASVLAQGAGQTDMLRALMGAARNWQANVDEGRESYRDTLAGINQSITDLNMDTQTALSNVHSQGESERERLWQDYYNRRSETYTELGNLQQQQADYLDLAQEQKVGGGGGAKKTASGESFMKASEEAGKSYKKQALPDWIEDWQGTARQESVVRGAGVASAPVFTDIGRVEGSNRRRAA